MQSRSTALLASPNPCGKLRKFSFFTWTDSVPAQVRVCTQSLHAIELESTHCSVVVPQPPRLSRPPPRHSSRWRGPPRSGKVISRLTELVSQASVAPRSRRPRIRQLRTTPGATSGMDTAAEPGGGVDPRNNFSTYLVADGD